MQFAEIVVPLARHLSWSHFLVLIPVKNKDARTFYAQKAAYEKWSKRQLRKSIEQKVFERKEKANTKNNGNYSVKTNISNNHSLLTNLTKKGVHLLVIISFSIMLKVLIYRSLYHG
ncbi:MAG: DUF1016 N-terminal domain-containing protein, partial [Bacteroidales bacterium]|nr:DUF1016 N-terminal domain-containing protein [Bacteroidales bacterium]